MAKVYILKQIYDNPTTGEQIPYERLAISGSLNGETMTLELKLEKSQLQLAKALLNSDEKLDVSLRNGDNGTKIDVKRKKNEEAKESILDDVESELFN